MSKCCRYGHLKKHIQTVHLKIKCKYAQAAKLKVHKCDWCPDVSFKYKKNLIYHQATKHFEKLTPEEAIKAKIVIAKMKRPKKKVCIINTS